jgi:type II secretory pathway pseudopilin PulG
MNRSFMVHTRLRQRGFTYLWLLLVLATGGAGLAALGVRASAAVQRERETELVFRGQEIARAIAAYRAATPGQAKALPESLQLLLEDRRGPQVVHHLRRLYADPFTGEADWVLVRTEDGLIAGVHSRAAVAAFRVADLPVPRPSRPLLVSDRLFMFSPLAAASALPQE